MRKEVEEELRKLNNHQRDIVLKGLEAKLAAYKRKGYISYKYEVCPVCKDVGSTPECQKCEGCYIKISCKEPFAYGFRDNHEKGFEYFSGMYELLKGLE